MAKDSEEEKGARRQAMEAATVKASKRRAKDARHPLERVSRVGSGECPRWAGIETSVGGAVMLRITREEFSSAPRNVDSTTCRLQELDIDGVPCNYLGTVRSNGPKEQILTGFFRGPSLTFSSADQRQDAAVLPGRHLTRF
jgi:hypothetical protein